MSLNEDTYRIIEEYLEGTLSEVEVADFEQQLKTNQELADAYVIFKELNDVIDEDNWPLTKFDDKLEAAQKYLKYYTQPENKNFLKDLESMSVANNDSSTSVKKDNVFSLQSVLKTAALAAVIVIGFLIFRPNPTPFDSQMAWEKNKDFENLPSILVRATDPDSITKLMFTAERNFTNQSYQEANEIYSQASEIVAPEHQDIVRLYHALALAEEGKEAEAILVINKVADKSNSILQPRATWYKAMILIKQMQPDEAKAVLKEIASDRNHYKRKEAKKILRGLRKYN